MGPGGEYLRLHAALFPRADCVPSIEKRNSGNIAGVETNQTAKYLVIYHILHLLRPLSQMSNYGSALAEDIGATGHGENMP